MGLITNMKYIEKTQLNNKDPIITVGGLQINNLLLMQNNMTGGDIGRGGQRTHFQLFERLKNLGIPAGLYVSNKCLKKTNIIPEIINIKDDYNTGMDQLFDEFTTMVGINARAGLHNKTKSKMIEYKNQTKKYSKK
jgi:hypothetical protein